MYICADIIVDFSPLPSAGSYSSSLPPCFCPIVSIRSPIHTSLSLTHTHTHTPSAIFGRSYYCILLSVLDTKPLLPVFHTMNQCFPTFLPWRNTYNNFSYPDRTHPMRMFTGQKFSGVWRCLQYCQLLDKDFPYISRDI